MPAFSPTNKYNYKGVKTPPKPYQYCEVINKNCEKKCEKLPTKEV